MGGRWCFACRASTRVHSVQQCRSSALLAIAGTRGSSRMFLTCWVRRPASTLRLRATRPSCHAPLRRRWEASAARGERWRCCRTRGHVHSVWTRRRASCGRPRRPRAVRGLPLWQRCDCSRMLPAALRGAPAARGAGHAPRALLGEKRGSRWRGKAPRCSLLPCTVTRECLLAGRASRGHWLRYRLALKAFTGGLW